MAWRSFKIIPKFIKLCGDSLIFDRCSYYRLPHNMKTVMFFLETIDKDCTLILVTYKMLNSCQTFCFFWKVFTFL